MKFFATLIMTVLFAVPLRAEITIQEVTSAGGIKAWLVHEPSIPFVALELRFEGGASLDAEGKRGATTLMVGLLEEGTGDLDAQGFARATEGLAASFGYDVYDDAVSISARFLSENRDQALDLLRQSLVKPAFNPAAVERVQGQILSIIQSDLKNPDDIASEAFDAMAFGTHPYGSSRNGTMQSVAALGRDDLFAAHAAALAKDRLYVAVVGDITAKELGPLLDELLGDLPEMGTSMPSVAKNALTGGVSVIDYDTPQSVAVFGHQGIKRDDPDFFAAYILNVVLGGGSFESRLMQEVREKRGLTYGVYSYLAPMNLAELYMGSVASANDRIAEAVDVIRAEWARMAQDGVTKEELETAKSYLTGSYPLRFDGNGAIASIMAGMQMQGLPTDYIVTRNAKIDAVTIEDVNRVARELLQPDDLRFVVVGRPVGL